MTRKIRTITDPEIITKAIELGIYEALKDWEKEQNIEIGYVTVIGVEKQGSIRIEVGFEEKEEKPKKKGSLFPWKEDYQDG